MIRNLMASSALALLISAGSLNAAAAQTETQPAATQPADANTTDMAPGAGDATLTPDQPTIATAYIGRPVYSSSEPNSASIGDVNDLIIGDEGMITHAVVGVGGFLGIGEKNVAVPFDELQVQEGDSGDIRLIYQASREQLQNAPAFDRTAYDPRQRAAEKTSTAENNAAQQPATGDQSATTPAVNGATGDNQMAANNVAAPAPAPATADVTAAPAAGAMGNGAFVNYSADQLRASTMIGKALYGGDNENIGTVSDLVLDADGKTRSALVDVGGFLGIGAKQVAIPFTSIKAVPDTGDADANTASSGAANTGDVGANTAAQNNAASNDAGSNAEPRLTVAMTRDQLQNAPAYVSPSQAEAKAQTQAAADAPAAGAVNTNASTGGATTAMAPDGTAATTGNAAAGNMAAGNMAADNSAAGNMAAGTTTTADGTTQRAADPTLGTYAPVSQDLTAENLMGATVYGTNEDSIGRVGDVVFNQGGNIEAIVVDVGGFLGIGAKPVAVQFDALQVQRDESGDLRLKADTTKEALQNAPSYSDTASAGTTTQPAVQ